MATLVQRFARLLERVFLGEDFVARTKVASTGSTTFLSESFGSAGRRDARRETRSMSADDRKDERASGPDAPFLLSVDDAGQFLVVSGERLVLGHVRGGRADLPFLADVGTTHAVLERVDSFRDGTVWSIAPLGRESVSVNGRSVSERVPLAGGDRVLLGENLHFRFEIPDPGSQTTLLRFPEGIDCGGGRNVLLFAPGEGGRIRIGSGAHRHVRVPNLDHEIIVTRSGERLHVRCAANIHGAEGVDDRTDSDTADRDPGGVSMPLPFERRFDLSIGKPDGGRPPFGIAFGPSEVDEANR